jgi:hypothetical protein
MRANRSLIGVIATALLAGACAPEAPSDDAGPLAWNRQVVRHLLHRNLRGADEARLLVDLTGIVGRREVARMLMAEPEFARAQTHQLMDQLEVQRDSSPLEQPQSCFAQLQRLPATGDGGALARWVRDRPMQDSIAAPPEGPVYTDGAGASGAWNFVDLAYSSILEDDMRPLFKAYMVPAVVGSEFNFPVDEVPSSVGFFFNRVFLGRDLGCTLCHNTQYSLTNTGSWQRTHPLPVNLEQSVWGCTACSTEEQLAAAYNVFRQDASGKNSGDAKLEPWGLDPACGSLALQPTAGPMPTHFAGLVGDHYGIADVLEQFGDASLEPYGEFRCTPHDPLEFASYDQIAGDDGLVWGVAANFAQKAWGDLMGSPLTLTHGFARNADQMLLHCELTERVLRSGWSLRDLLAEIVTRPEYNRRAPASSTRPGPFEQPLFFDPFTPVAADPEAPEDPCTGPEPLAATCFNGKGEQVVRYAPQHLLRRTHRMLGWPEPELYPTEDAVALARDLDQYQSTRYPGSEGWSFQSLLTWEDATAGCEKPASMGDQPDWIDRLVQAVPAFDAQHPGAPLTLHDLVETVRDWLLQDAALAIPGGGGFVDPDSTEAARIAAVLGVADLGLHAASLGDALGERLRDYCGVLVKTPHYTLTEVPAGGTLTSPRLQVCNEAPCGYQAMCQHYRSTLARMGHAVTCAPGGVSEPLGLQLTPLDPDPDPEIDDLTTAAAVRHLAEMPGSELESLLDAAGHPLTRTEIATLQQILIKTPEEQLLRALPRDVSEGGIPDGELSRQLEDLARHTLAVGCVDRDRDGICDSKDLCPDWAARSHGDADGNGIGDDCECGDQSGDARVDVRDLVAINVAIFNPKLASPLCDANADGACDVSDVIAASQKIFGKPAYCSRYPRP